MPAEGRENPLLKKGNSDAFFREKYLTKNTSSTEKEESTGRRIHLKLVFDNGAESVKGFSHICIAADNVDLLKSGDVT